MSFTTPLSGLDLAVIAAYFAVVLGVGLFMVRFVKNAGDFFSGGKRVPWWMGTFVFARRSQVAYVPKQ